MSRRDAEPGLVELFAGSGPAAAALRAVDWPDTALGATDIWPTDLRYAAYTVVRAAAPMALWWGPDFVQLHNDAMTAALRGDGPAVGRPAGDCSPERWQVLGPLVQRVLTTCAPLHADEVVLPVEGSSTSFWTMSLAPLRDDEGAVRGVLANVVDLTARVTGYEHERRSADAAAANLQVALTSNRRIGTAIGILMAHRRITDTAAFDLLREASQRAHRKLRDIADDVVLTGALPD